MLETLYRCSHCQQELAVSAFPPSAIRKSDFRCLSCHRIKNKKQRDKSPSLTRKIARERMRKWREANPRARRANKNPERAREAAIQYAKNHPDVKRAHRIVERAIKRGELVRQPCEKCGAACSHAHHDDYSKPLQVRWLCAKDHAREHKWVN